MLRLWLVPRKYEEKYNGKKVERKSRRKEKIKENKIDFNPKYYFYLLDQTHFICFNSSV